MTRWPLLGLLAVSVSVGLYLAIRFLRGARNRPALIALHIVPGLIALEVAVLLMREANRASAGPAGTSLVKAGLVLLVVAILAGVLTPLIARDRPRIVALVSLSTHALLALGAITLIGVWALVT
jgi:hypothetical protein